MFGKEEGKDKPKKNIINDRDPRSRSRRRDLAIDAARARDGAISRMTRRKLTTARSRDAVDRDLGRRRDRDQLHDLTTVRSLEGEIAIDALRDRAVDRNLGSRSTARSSDWICRR